MLKIPYQSIRAVYKKCLLPVLPYSLSLALLYILIEPKTKPTFSDSTDWMALALFILGLFAVCVLHACIVYQINAYTNIYPTPSKVHKNSNNNEEDEDNIFMIVAFGFKKMFPVFIMSICYLLLVALGLVGLIIPGIYLFIVGSMSLFIIVLKDTNPVAAFVESYKNLSKKWLTFGLSMLSLVVLFSTIEFISSWIFTELVVFSTLFSVLIRGFLWPIAYITMMVLFAEPTPAMISEIYSSKSPRRTRKGKLMPDASN